MIPPPDGPAGAVSIAKLQATPAVPVPDEAAPVPRFVAANPKLLKPPAADPVVPAFPGPPPCDSRYVPKEELPPIVPALPEVFPDCP